MVDIISDVMCPWCYIGKRRLEAAVRQSALAFDLKWRPFQLDATLPQEGKDRGQYLAEKFGSAERAAELYETIRAAGAEEAIDFAFDKIAVSPNTIDAHRLIRWAGGVDPETQDRVVESLFRAYFLEGSHIGEASILVEIARRAGMDAELVAELLQRGDDRDRVTHEIALAQQMGVTGVPTFIVNNKYALIGAQPADTLVNAFQQIAAAPDDG